MDVATLHLLLLLLLPLFAVQSSPTPLTQNSTPPKEYFEVTLPLPTDSATPTCSVNVLTHTFGNTSARPSISVAYTPPPVTCKWSHAVLQYQAEYNGKQRGSIAGVWIAGVQLLRTSTAHPTEDGVLWSARKDVTKYSSILTGKNQALSLMLGNLENDAFTGVYKVNVSLLFYSDNGVTIPSSVVAGESEAHTLNRKLISVNAGNVEVGRVIQSLYPYETPADLIVPISGGLDEGYWFKIQNELDMRTANVQISQKTYKAVLELYVSFHGDDEFWYMNLPEANNSTTGKGRGAYREVLVSIDGNLVGTAIPFPVIFPSGINPLFWSPFVSIGAFDVPSYDIDFTPFLGILSDNKNHAIGLQVAGGLSFWLVDANLHLWLGGSNVQATGEFEQPAMEIETEYDFEEGEFQTEVKRASKGTGWVQSSTGLVKTKVKQEIGFKNKLKIKDGGRKKVLEQEITVNAKIKIRNEKGGPTSKIEIENTYPLTITIESAESSSDKDASQTTTTVVQGRSESLSNEKAKISRVLNHEQSCTSTTVVMGNSIIKGSVENHQNYDYQDGLGCYSRKIDVVDTDVVTDDTLLICPR